MEGFLPPLTPAELIELAFAGRLATIINRMPEVPELDMTRWKCPAERRSASCKGEFTVNFKGEPSIKNFEECD